MTDYRVVRKVYMVGKGEHGSLAISLPPVWAKANGIVKGSEVELIFNGYDGLLVRKCVK